MLKQRFRCLLGTLLFEPEKCAKVIQCCIILHNLVLRNQDLEEIEEDLEDNVADANLESEADTEVSDQEAINSLVLIF